MSVCNLLLVLSLSFFISSNSFAFYNENLTPKSLLTVLTLSSDSKNTGVAEAREKIMKLWQAKKKDLKKPITESGDLNVDGLYFVHLTNTFPQNGEIYPTSHYPSVQGSPLFNAFDTIHGSLNTTVIGSLDEIRSPDFYNARYMVLIPLKDIFEEVVNITPNDTIKLGPISLTENAVVVSKTAFIPPEHSLSEFQLMKINNDDARSWQDLMTEILLIKGVTPMDIAQRVDDHGGSYTDPFGGWFNLDNENLEDKEAFNKMRAKGMTNVHHRDTQYSSLRKFVDEAQSYLFDGEIERRIYDPIITFDRQEGINLNEETGLRIFIENFETILKHFKKKIGQRNTIDNGLKRLVAVSRQTLYLVEELSNSKPFKKELFDSVFISRKIAVIKKALEGYNTDLKVINAFFRREPQVNKMGFDLMSNIKELLESTISENWDQGREILYMLYKSDKKHFDFDDSTFLQLIWRDSDPKTMQVLIKIFMDNIELRFNRLEDNKSKRIFLKNIYDNYLRGMLEDSSNSLSRNLLRQFILNLDNQYRHLLDNENAHLFGSKEEGMDFLEKEILDTDFWVHASLVDKLIAIRIIFDIERKTKNVALLVNYIKNRLGEDIDELPNITDDKLYEGFFSEMKHYKKPKAESSETKYEHLIYAAFEQAA